MNYILLALLVLLSGCGGTGEMSVSPAPSVEVHQQQPVQKNPDITRRNPHDTENWWFSGSGLYHEWRRLGSEACQREISCRVRMVYLAQQRQPEKPNLELERRQRERERRRRESYLLAVDNESVGDVSMAHVHSWGAWRSGYVDVHGRTDRRIRVKAGVANDGLPLSWVTFRDVWNPPNYRNYASSLPLDTYTWTGKMYGYVEEGLPRRGHGMGLNPGPERLNRPMVVVTMEDVMDVRADVEITVNDESSTGSFNVTDMQYRTDLDTVYDGPHADHSLEVQFHGNGTFQGGSLETGGILGRFIGETHSAATGSYGRFGVSARWAATRSANGK